MHVGWGCHRQGSARVGSPRKPLYVHVAPQRRAGRGAQQLKRETTGTAVELSNLSNLTGTPERERRERNCCEHGNGCSITRILAVGCVAPCGTGLLCSSMSSTSSSEDEEEVRRRAAMASCVMSAQEVLASATQKAKPRATHTTQPMGDATAEDATSTCQLHNRSDRPFQKMTSERLHALLTKTLDSRIAESVWTWPTQQRVSLQLRVFAGTSTTQASQWPPLPRGGGLSAARPTDVPSLVALADLANKGAQGKRRRAGACSTCGAACAVCAADAGRQRERKRKSERKSKRERHKD